jgi:catechol 2,3-dioxygenase-like lactoylglutathione lyase family enzyme
MEWNALVPELVVADYERSKAFYVDVFGFAGRFEGRRAGSDTSTKGKGLHFQIEIPAISGMLERLDKASVPLASDVVESWYRQDTLLHGQKEFFVADPDGYLYRFYEYIGQR